MITHSLLLAALSGFVLMPIAFAGHSVGNGADAVLRGEEALLLDFVEAGIEDSAVSGEFFFPQPKHEAYVRSELRRIFMGAPVTETTLELTAQKLCAVEPVAAYSLLIALGSYRWSWTGESLGDVIDEDLLISVPRERLRQAAIRRNHSILIQKSLWERMPAIHQAGLLIHEAIYSLIRPVLTGVRSGDVQYWKQESPLVRQIVADLFSPHFQHPATGSSFTRYRVGDDFALPFGEPGNPDGVTGSIAFTSEGGRAFTYGVQLQVRAEPALPWHHGQVNTDHPFLGVEQFADLEASRPGSPAVAEAGAIRTLCRYWLEAGSTLLTPAITQAKEMRFRFEPYETQQGTLLWLRAEKTEAPFIAALFNSSAQPVSLQGGEPCEETIFRGLRAWIRQLAGF